MVVSSLRGNVGDLGAASSVASLIKTVLVLEHAQVPGTPPHSKSMATPITDPAGRVLHSPSSNTRLSAPLRRGKLITATVNCLEDTGRNGAAVIQQYSVLPHLAGVSSWLFLAADHIVTDKCWPKEEEVKASFYKETVETLKAHFPIFSNSFTWFTKVFDATVKRYNFDSVELLAARNKVLVLKLYYGFMAQFFISGLQIPTIGATNAMNEVAALLFAGSIDLSTAILFLCCKHVSSQGYPERVPRYKIKPERLARSVRRPKISIFSCIKNDRLSEETFSDRDLLLGYISELCASIGRTNVFYDMSTVLMRKGPVRPLVHITSSPDNTAAPSGSRKRNSLVIISFNSLQDEHSTQYLRDKYLGLRSYHNAALARAHRVMRQVDSEEKAQGETEQLEVQVDTEKAQKEGGAKWGTPV